MSVQKEYLEWRRGAEVGCAFARLIAQRPSDYNQKIEVLQDGRTADLVAGNIAVRIDRLVANANVNAAVLLFPKISSLEKLAAVSWALGQQPMWNVTTSPLQNATVGTMTAIHIVREIPFGRETCPSEALVFGPFQEFPPTRRAPVAAMEIYVGEPRTNDPKTGAPTTKANLAHMELNLPVQKAFDSLWQSSMKGRLDSNGGEDNRAKAKISFVIPSKLAVELGIAT